MSYFAPGQTELTKEDAYWYAAGIIVSSAVTVFTFHPLILYIFEIGTSMRIGCSGLIYKKVYDLIFLLSVNYLRLDFVEYRL